MSTQTVSKQTQKNWWIDAGLFLSAVTAALSGIYFLFLPGGYQGGRNPLYNIQIWFTRQTWDELHTWGGVAMIVAALVHLGIHWSWVVNMSRRAWHELTGKSSQLNARSRWNVILNATVALSFVLTALSGVYFLYFPGGRHTADPMLLFSRPTWDLIHTWAGVVMIVAAILHFAIHWKWVTKVTSKMAGMALPTRPITQQAAATHH